MSEQLPEVSKPAVEVSHDINPFDDLHKFLEERERTEAEILQAVEKAARYVVANPDDYPTGEEEIVAIALDFGIEPDSVIEIIESLEQEGV